jgi:hypothetical protein
VLLGEVTHVHDAHLFWLRAPGRGEIRPVTQPDPGPGDVLVRTIVSGISRGSETLVFRLNGRECLEHSASLARSITRTNVPVRPCS